MLLNQATQEGIRDGQIDLVFRRWRRPTVKTGGTLRCSVGELSIRGVQVIDPTSIDDAQARRAGFDGRGSLIDDLFRERRPGGRARTAQVDGSSELYRVEVAFAGADARVALRSTLLNDDELAQTIVRLASIDRRSARGPWTTRSLQLIATWPGRRAPELAEIEGQETLKWKAEIRRLKELGLTESLAVGYRLSPRGEQVLAAIDEQTGAT